jgi:hypothetical protein
MGSRKDGGGETSNFGAIQAGIINWEAVVEGDWEVGEVKTDGKPATLPG